MASHGSGPGEARSSLDSFARHSGDSSSSLSAKQSVFTGLSVPAKSTERISSSLGPAPAATAFVASRRSVAIASPTRRLSATGSHGT